jgi:hypothetical protein
MNPIPITAYKRRSKFNDLDDDNAAKLVRLIKISSEQNGILIMKTLRNSIKKALIGRRLKEFAKPKFVRVKYQWLPVVRLSND